MLGLISGTSADGVDAALCRFAWRAGSGASAGDPPGAPGRLRAGALAFELLAARTWPYPPALRERVLAAAGLETPGLAALDVELGERFADAALALCHEANLPPDRLDLIGSHGQTVWHDPRGRRAGVPATLQLGEPAVIAARTRCDVVADFRVADVALGGEGAPLVPVVDFLLLSRAGTPRAVLNLGGIANVTWLPGSGGPEDVRAFDTGPANALSDGLVRRLGLAPEGYDPGGRLALAGRSHPALLEELLAEPFFALPPPRSTGRELFGEAFVERMVRRGAELDLAPCDLLATAAELCARSAADAVRSHCGAPAEVLLCGGGRRNAALRAALARLFPGAAVRDTDEAGLDGDAKEAVAFAALAYLAARGLPNHLPHTTGASRAAMLGKLAPGRIA